MCTQIHLQDGKCKGGRWEEGQGRVANNVWACRSNLGGDFKLAFNQKKYRRRINDRGNVYTYKVENIIE